MAPAFSSPKQAAAFAALLLGILLLPALVGSSALPPRERIYSAERSWFGPYSYLHEQIFEEKGDIDIAFVGSSHLWSGIDTPYVQKELSAKLGRPAVVRSFGWPWAGFDALHFIAKDLLENRKVRMLVIHQESRGKRLPHSLAPRWFRFGDDSAELAGLGGKAQASFYYAAILGMPLNLLHMLRPNLPADPATDDYWKSAYQADGFAATLGSLSAQIGFRHKPGDPNFEPYSPQTNVRPSDARIYSPQISGMFDFSGPAIPRDQLHFARKVALLAQHHRTKLVILHLPDTTEIRAAAIHEPGSWPQALGMEPAIVGIPPATLFAGLTDEEVRQLFYDPGHMNRNGQRYFTPLITPSLLQIYDAETKR